MDFLTTALQDEEVVMSMKDTGLVLEGGGLRGVFTCGVLDCFMDHGIRFPFTVGVSAGACNGLSYMSGQRGRAKASNIDLMDEHHYIGFRYNRTLDLIERLEDEGRITVIRPLRPVEVGRMEKDTAKLTALYQEGYDVAKKLIEEHSLF